MITETGRIILSYLLAQDQESISSKKLADLCNLSLSTIRNEINWLNEGLIPYGVHIDAKQSQGCRLIIDDEHKAELSFQQLKYDLRRKLFNFNSKSYRSDYIVRRLLISSTYVSAEKLSEELFFSSSTVLRSINYAQSVIKRYNLEIKLKKNHGLYIEGNEFNKRVYMLTQHKKFMHLDPVKKAQEIKFSDYFLTGSQQYRTIKNTIIKLLKNYPELEFSFINTPKLVNYLILCRQRHAYTKEITFTTEQLNYIRNEKAYNFSKDVFTELKHFMGFEPSEKDTLSFAQIVLGCRSLNSLSQISKNRADQMLPVCTQLFTELFQIENLDVSMLNDEIIQQFTLCVETVFCRLLMQVPFDMEMFYPVRDHRAVTSDLCLTLMKLIKKHFNMHVDELYLRSFTYLFERIFDSYDKTSISLKVLVVSFYGADYARNVAAYLNRKYHRYIDAIDISEYTTGASLNQNQYDLILTDLSSSFFIGENVHSTDLSQREHLRSEFESILQKHVAHNLNTLIHDRVIKTKFKSKQDVFEFISSQFSNQDYGCEDLIQDLQKRDQFFSSIRSQKLAFISTYEADFKDSHMMILINDKEIEWNRSKAQFFIFYTYNKSKRKDAITIHRSLKRILEMTSSDLEELFHQKNIVSILAPKKYS